MDLWKFSIGLVSAVGIFMFATFILASIIYMWGPNNRYGDPGKPHKFGTFAWSWEMSVKFTATLVFLAFGSWIVIASVQLLISFVWS